jgi:protein disulfide-isomerase A1
MFARTRQLLLLAAVSLVCSLGAAEDTPPTPEKDRPGEKMVLEVSEDNFDEVVDNNEYVLLFFYAPWCSHCNSLKPIFADAAETLHNEGIGVQLAKVDATQHMDLAKEFGLKGYPTLKWFHNSEPDDYTGQRSTAAIVKWVKGRSGNTQVKTLANVEELEKFKADNSVVVVGHFAAEACEAPEDGGMIDTFTSAALDTDIIPCVLVSVFRCACQVLRRCRN